MYRILLSLILISLLASASVFAQRDYPEVEKPKVKPKVKTTRPTRPRGPQVAANRANGVLFVLTDPPTASVVIKSRGNPVRQGRSEDGQFRAELPPGSYDIEVTSENHKTFTAKALVKQTGTQPVDADLVPTTGSILLGLGGVDTDVSVYLDGRKLDSPSRKAENQIEFDAIPAGMHKLRVTHPTIADWERNIEIEGGATTTVTPKFAAAVVNLTVKSEPGSSIYVDNDFQGRVAESGELKIMNQLRPGEHTIRAEKDLFEPARLVRKFDVGDATVEMKLKRVVFSGEFADTFLGGAMSWDAPKDWKFEPGKLTVRGSGVAGGLVKEKLYSDFRMEFDTKFLNGKGAVWIVRARDRQNYYLFQLMGPKSAARNTFHSYICQNGQIRLLRPPEFLALDLSRPDDSFHIIVEAKGDQIKHSIEVSSAPAAGGPRPLSVITDATITQGTVGFATKDSEEYVVFYVNVTPLK
ncbi:MAG TPA: carboxypeptidase-like regulatory domain-containing protein [Blastocatellia bacterium]|nr:carboxypeptidase-like regulatory domain-containing protein [Blastocatellia bacterium]